MEAREEKLLMARASFQNEGSPKYFREEKKKEENYGKGKSRYLFLLRFTIAALIFGIFVYGDRCGMSKFNEISKKSFARIQKNEINIEKYSALFGQMW